MSLRLVGNTRRALALAIASSVLWAADGAAQERKVFAMIGGGPAVPVGSFGDGFGAGWNLSAGMAGGGVAVRAGSIGVYAEAPFTAIPGSGHSHLPLVVGVRLGRQ